jgi:hypothetical protein
MLAHGIQLLQCRLSTLFLICHVKQLKIWLDFLHIRVHVKHGIVPLAIHDIMCTRSSNTFTLLLENRQLTQQNFYYVVLHRMSIHIVGHEKYLLEKFVISLHANASAIQHSTLVLLGTVTLNFFSSLS